jgi:peroxiredoxin Q/BCP
MAAKKKSAPSKSKAAVKANPAAKRPVKKAVAKPAKATKQTATAKSATAGKPARPAKVKLPALPVKAAKASKASAPSKAAAKPEKQAKLGKPAGGAIAKTVKRAVQKVKQAAAQVAAKFDADAGRPAPSFELVDEKGETVSSSSLAGKPYLLYFYPKDDTPGCTKEACDIRDNFGRFGKQGVRVLGVSPDSQQSHAKFGKKYGLPFTLLSDPDKTLANAYGVWGLKNNYGKEYMGIIRSTFLVGADGEIKRAYRGVKVDGHVDAILNDAQALL